MAAAESEVEVRKDQRQGPNVTCEVVDGIADVRLNRPEVRNAVNDAMFFDIIAAAVALQSAAGLRAVVLSGEGQGFCAGMDRAIFEAMGAGGSDGTWRAIDSDERAAEMVDIDGLTLGRSQRAVLVWQTIPVPVIAAVHGVAVGFGLQLALGADIRIVDPDVRLGALEGNWGLAPDSCGTQILPRLIGSDLALELCLTSRFVGAEEAVRMGLATGVAEDPRADAFALARVIASRSPAAMRSSTRLIRLATTGTRQAGLLAEREEMVRNVGSDEQRESMTALREGRAPNFVD
jgi:enoyl-CoA hydratase/carnithine racemase